MYGVKSQQAEGKDEGADYIVLTVGDVSIGLLFSFPPHPVFSLYGAILSPNNNSEDFHSGQVCVYGADD